MIFVVVPYRHKTSKAALGAMAYTGYASIEALYRDLLARHRTAVNRNKFAKIIEAIDRGDWLAIPDSL